MTGLDFDGLHKIPAQPAARLMAQAGMKLGVPVSASASVPAVLQLLDRQGAVPDMMHLMAVALPAREAVWWACLAARDLLADGATTACLTAAEAWVFKPDAAARAAAQRAMEGAEKDDLTVYCAVAAVYGDGAMGTGELAQHAAPPAAVCANVLAMNLKSLAAHEDNWQAHALWLVARALDIARGGNGGVEPPAWAPPAPAELEGEV